MHLGERGDAVEVGGEALQAGVGDVGVGVVEAGHGEGAVEVDLVRLRRGAFQDVGVGAGEDDAVGGDAEGLDALRCGVVVGVEADAGEDVAVVVDGVGGFCAAATEATSRIALNVWAFTDGV